MSVKGDIHEDKTTPLFENAMSSDHQAYGGELEIK
jgi:hypothetical protein